jgi:hypothetical protein
MTLKERVKALFSKETYLLADGSLDTKKLFKRTLVLMLFIFSLYFIGFQFTNDLGRTSMLWFSGSSQTLGLRGPLYVISSTSSSAHVVTWCGLCYGVHPF